MGLVSPKLSTKTMVPLCRQLATAYDAGIPVLQSLDLVGRQFQNKRVRSILQQMSHDIRHGESLHAAAQNQSKHLPRFFVELLGTGEYGGRLDVMLRDLAEYYEDRIEMNREIMGQMWYPIMLIVVAVNLIPLAFQGLKQAMSPSGGSGNIGDIFAKWFEAQIYYGIQVAIAAAVIFVLFRMGIFQWVWGFVTTFIWPFSRVSRKLGMARFFRSFALLLGSGMNVMAAIDRSAAVINNPYIEREVVKAIPIVKNGATLTEAFAGCRYLSPTAREMLIVGEESGELEKLLKKLAQYHQAEAMTALRMAIKTFTTLFQLAIYVGAGAFIIYFWVSLYGGMMNDMGI